MAARYSEEPTIDRAPLDPGDKIIDHLIRQSGAGRHFKRLVLERFDEQTAFRIARFKEPAAVSTSLHRIAVIELQSTAEDL